MKIHAITIVYYVLFMFLVYFRQGEKKITFTTGKNIQKSLFKKIKFIKRIYYIYFWFLVKK